MRFLPFRACPSTCVRAARVLLVVGAGWVGTGLSPVQATESVPRSSPYLLGDWGGARPSLAQKGVAFDLYASAFDHGAVRGSAPRGTRLGGRFDLYIDLDGGKLVGWNGGGVSAKVELKTGEVGRQAGAILATNAGLLSPLGFKDRPVITSLYVKQSVPGATILLGRINALDLLRQAPMIGGRGLDGFLHMEYAAPVSGLTPIVLTGAVVIFPSKSGSTTLMVYDPNDSTNNGGFHRYLADGVNVALSYGTPTGWTKFPGSQSFGVKFSTRAGTDLSEIGLTGTTPRERRGSWHASYQVEQYLNPRWGFFVMLGLADGNPNLHQNSFQLGVSGKGLFRGRPQDRFGLGYFNFGFSDALVDALKTQIALRRETGTEAFYNFEVRPGLNLSGVAQWVRSANRDVDDSLSLGLRAVVRF